MDNLSAGGATVVAIGTGRVVGAIIGCDGLCICLIAYQLVEPLL